MITLEPLADKKRVKELFAKNKIIYNENSACVSADCGGETLGYCLFDLDDKQITVRYLIPQSDLSLADGILRSTLHVAAQRSIMDARFENPADEPFFKALEFIKDSKKKQLDIDKLFKSCCGCKK